MNNDQLKLAIGDDITRIKNLKPEIIPARVYYGSLIKVAWSGFWKIFVIVFLTLAYSFAFNTKVETPATIFEVATAATIVGSFLSALAILMLLSPINFFILFRFHLENELKTGHLIVRKLKLIATVFFFIFAILCALFGSYGLDTQIILMLVFAFFGSIGSTYALVKMEINRIGISTISAVVREFFTKGKEIKIELPDS